MESQEQSPGDVVTAGEDSHPITQAIDAVEVTHAGATAPAANTMDPPTIPLAPMKRMQARFNPLADGLMYVVVCTSGISPVRLAILREILQAVCSLPPPAWF